MGNLLVNELFCKRSLVCPLKTYSILGKLSYYLTMSQLEKKILVILMVAVLVFSIYFLISSWLFSSKSPISDNYIFNKPEFISNPKTEDKQYSVRFYTTGKVGDIVRKYLALLAKDRWNILEIKTVGSYNTILISRPHKGNSDISDFLIIQIDGANASDDRRGVTLTYWLK